MNKQANFYFCLMALVIALSSWGTAAAQNTKLGTGALGSDTTGSDDTALGYYALGSNTTGNYNTATGLWALRYNTTGSYNTATGVSALRFNTKGYYNTATGVAALYSNSTGSDNTANGVNALYNNTTGNFNTAAGVNALFSNTTGSYNTAAGFDALYKNTGGSNNTAIGDLALQTNTGSGNTACGGSALQGNTTGFYNTATGVLALAGNTTGIINTASGFEALQGNTTGAANIALGYQAGMNLTTGYANIDIFDPGVAGESYTIRIGTQGTQSATYIAGISGTGVMGTDVVVNGSGQLGVVMSSARYKRDIHDMGEASSGLMKLRPVTFRYNNDRTGTRQYGLVAEEVERVYPELVTYGADGRAQSVRYSMLTSMLLNEMQKQARQVQDQSRRFQSQAIVLQQETNVHRRVARQLAITSAQLAEIKAWTAQAAGELKGNYERELRPLQERLAALEQAMQMTGGAGRLAAAKP